MAAYRRARELDPTVRGIGANLGDALSRLERWEDAVSEYQRSIGEAPDQASTHVNLGSALARLNRWKEAVSAYRQAQAREPSMSGLSGWLAAALMNVGSWSDALVHCEAAVRENPGAASTHAQLGHVLFQLRRWEAAAAAYQQALDIDPDLVGLRRPAAISRAKSRLPEATPELANLRDVVIDLEITSVCDAVCTFCPRSAMPDKKRYMSLQAVEKLAHEVAKNPGQIVVLCGIGESTLHPELDKIVRMLAEADATVELTTHGGGRLDATRFEALVALGLSGVNFSINASSADTHRRIMGLRNFDETVANVRAVLGARNRSHPEVNVHVSFVVCDQNQHEVRDFVDFWRPLGPSRIWLHPVNNRAGLLSPGVKSVDLRELARRYAGDDKVVVDVFGDLEQETQLCKIAKTMIFISADAQMRLCAMDYKRVTSNGSLLDATLGDMHRDKLERYQRGEMDNLCRDCDFCPPAIRSSGMAANPIGNSSGSHSTTTDAIASESDGQLAEGEAPSSSPPDEQAPELAEWRVQQGLGDTALQAGRWEAAVTAFRRTIGRQPRAVSSHVSLGHSLCRLGRWEEAVAAYRRARELDPEVPGACANLGDALLRLGRCEEAVGAYGDALRECPGAPAVLANVSHALIQLNRNAEAVEAYRRALAAMPGDPQLLRDLAAAEAAARTNRHAIDEEAGVTPAHVQPGRVSHAPAQSEGSIVAPELPEEASSHLELGRALAQSGRWTAAVDAYQRARKLAPHAPYVTAELAHALLNSGRLEEAVSAYRDAVCEQPHLVASHVNLGHALAQLKRLDEAEAAYRSAIELEPDVAAWYTNLGDLLGSGGRWAEAAAAYRHAVERDPEAAPLHLRLARVLDYSDRSADAVGAYERVLELVPGQEDARRGLAAALSKVGRLEDAAANYQRAIQEKKERAGWDDSKAGTGPIPEQLARGLSRLHHDLGDVLLKMHCLEDAAGAHRRADELTPAWSRSTHAVADPVARWVEGAWNAGSRDEARGPRLMFVLDNDYGELTTVMLLLFAQELAARSTLLLSERVYLNNRDVLPGRTHAFTSLEEIMQAVDRERPDVVFLCSAHLISLHGILTLDEQEQLLAFLRDEHCRVVTTDPFLGLLSDLGGSTTISIDIPANASPELQRAKHEQDARLKEHLSRTNRMFRDIPHLYPTYPSPIGALAPPSPRVLSFFNKSLRCPDATDATLSLGAPARSAEHKPRWLFILASRDYEAQLMFLGKERFVRLVIDKLHETNRAGRHAVFVAPYDLVQALVAEMPPTEAVTLLTFCPFKRFVTLLVDAELAFYWNIVSHSMLLRLMNRQPVFMFDKGHLVRNVVQLHDRVVDWYYQGHAPMTLDPEEPLDLEQLTERVRRSSSKWGLVSRAFVRAPTPTAMIDELVAGDD